MHRNGTVSYTHLDVYKRQLKNRIIDSERNGYGTELADILSTIDEQTAMDSETLKTRFWDMFIVDALIGNWDRHNGNWGFLYNNATDEVDVYKRQALRTRSAAYRTGCSD